MAYDSLNHPLGHDLAGDLSHLATELQAAGVEHTPDEIREHAAAPVPVKKLLLKTASLAWRSNQAVRQHARQKAFAAQQLGTALAAALNGSGDGPDLRAAQRSLKAAQPELEVAALATAREALLLAAAAWKETVGPRR